MAEPNPKPRSKRTPAIEQAILDALANGRSLRGACAELGIGATTFSSWLATDEALLAQYTRAREVYIQGQESRINELSEEMVAAAKAGGEGVSAVVAAYKAQIDNIKWELCKLLPKRYGDRLSAELSGPAGGPIAHSITVEMVPVVAAGAAQRVIEAAASESEEES